MTRKTRRKRSLERFKAGWLCLTRISSTDWRQPPVSVSQNIDACGDVANAEFVPQKLATSKGGCARRGDHEVIRKLQVDQTSGADKFTPAISTHSFQQPLASLTKHTIHVKCLKYVMESLNECELAALH